MPDMPGRPWHPEPPWIRRVAWTIMCKGGFHLEEEQGLLAHSACVTEPLLHFREFLAPVISEESCIMVGLFHDVGKLGMPGNATISIK